MALKLDIKKKGEHIVKRTNRKFNFKKFVESGCVDIEAFKNACRKDENLMIYTCLTDEELKPYLDKVKEFKTVDEITTWLSANQPYMNENVERYDRCCDSLAKYLKGFIEYSAFRSANANGSYEDFTSEFWLKYVRVYEFYRTRWFFREDLKKDTTVKYVKLLYKEFLYLVRSSISSERKHIGFKATQDNDASIFKQSLDTKFEQTSSSKNSEKTLGDVLPDETVNEETLFENAHASNIIAKALKIAESYPEGKELYDKIADFYEKQDTVGVDKKVVVLAKIFLYRAGLVSPKVLTFIKGLSPTYKQTYGISNMRLLRLLGENKQKKNKHIKTSKERSKDENLGWRDLILMRRGEL